MLQGCDREHVKGVRRQHGCLALSYLPLAPLISKLVGSSSAHEFTCATLISVPSALQYAVLCDCLVAAIFVHHDRNDQACIGI